MGKVEFLEKQTGVRLTSSYSRFDKSSHLTWQQAFFQVLEWKNTWDFALSATINAAYNHDAYLEIVLYKPDHADQCVEWLEGLGYRDILREDVGIAVLGINDLDIEYVCLE